MKRLTILTTIAILTASTTGCGCFHQLWGGVTGTIKCVFAPCTGRGQCVDAGYAGGYAEGCPGGECFDVGASLGAPYANAAPMNAYDGSMIPSDSYVSPPSNFVPREVVPTPNDGPLVPVPNGS